MSRVAVAMTDGAFGQGLAEALSSVLEVVAAPLDGLDLRQAEVALAGVEVLVLVPSAQRPQARLVQAEPADLELLRVDTLTRAASRAGVPRVVLVLSGEHGPGVEALVRASGLKVSLVQAGAVAEAAAAVRVALALPSKVAGEHSALAPATAAAGAGPVCSVQRLPLPLGWSAQAAAEAYFSWLGTVAPPLLRVERVPGRFTIRLLGAPMLKLSVLNGSPEGSCPLQVSGGWLVRSGSRARFEFRVLGTGGLITALCGFEPSLPWLVYRFTEAVLHTRTMRAFGRWLERQPAR